MANIRKVGARNKVSSRGKLYNMSDMLSESYRALFDCEKDSKLYKLVESHIQSLKDHPTELSIHSKNLTVIKGLLLKEASDLDIRLSDLKENDPDFEEEDIIEEDDDEVEVPEESEEEEEVEVPEESEDEKEEEEVVEESEEEEVPEEIEESEDEDELTSEELEELSKYLKEMRKARKMKESKKAEEEEVVEESEEEDVEECDKADKDLDESEEEEVVEESEEEEEEELEEAVSAPLKLEITSMSKNLTNSEYNKIFSLSHNGIEISPINDGVCTPWDADIRIENGDIVLFGSLVAGGAGTATARIPLSRAYRYWEFSIMPKNEDAAREILEILVKSNWVAEMSESEEPEVEEVEEGCGSKKMKESKKKGFLKKLKSR